MFGKLARVAVAVAVAMAVCLGSAGCVDVDVDARGLKIPEFGANWPRRAGPAPPPSPDEAPARPGV